MDKQAEINQLRRTMESFIDERLNDKLDKIEKQLKTSGSEATRKQLETKRQQLRAAHEPSAWITDAAQQVEQIQLVTHAIKFAHPDARGTSLYSAGNTAAGPAYIGTHSLPGKIKPDVVGNAAALDVFKFLRLEVQGKPLWQRAAEQDPAFMAALPGSAEERRDRLEAFAALAQPKDGPASHKLAKQLYWPLETGRYHLLQPIFPTSLAHAVWERLREARFSDEAKAARDARRKGETHSGGYRDWPDLAIQNFGGTKPQNISQLNSERHGEAWLLASLPPMWHSRDFHPPLRVTSLFERLARRRNVRERLEDLGQFLAGTADWNNVLIRGGRARRVDALIDEVLQQAAAIRSLEPGWSATAECELPEPQRFWLDPRRSDPEFVERRRTSDWPRTVAESFGTWLNAQLRKRRLPVGEAEYRAWRREFEPELERILEEMEL